MSIALAPVAVCGGMGSTGLSGPRASSTMWTRNASPVSGPWTPYGPRGTLRTLRLSITLGGSASSLAAPSSARTKRALSSPVLPLESITSPLGSRPRPRVSPTTTRSPRGFVTGGERISPVRLPTLMSERGTVGRVTMTDPLASGPGRILAGNTRLGLRWSTERSPARVRGMPTEAPLLGRRPTPGLLAPLRSATWAGRALATAGPGLALRSSGPASWMRWGRRWLARWVGRNPPAVGDPPSRVSSTLRRFTEIGRLPWADLPPLRLARWASPGVKARAPPTAPREWDRASAPATAIGVSSLARPLTRAPSRPLLTTRVSPRPVKSAGTCAPRQGEGLAPRGGVATARAGVASPLGLVDALGLLLGRAPIRWPWIRPRRTTTTRLEERPLGLGGPCPRNWTPVRRWLTPLWARSPHRPLASLVIDRLIALVKSSGEVLLTRSAPGLKTSRCLLLAPPMALAILSGVMGRTTRPCRPLTSAPPPRAPWMMFP